MKTILSIALAVGFAGQSCGASLLVDDFSQGEVFLSGDGLTGETILLDTPFGERRDVGITIRIVAPGTTLTAAIKPEPGQLEFVADGKTTVSNGRLFVDLFYYGDEPRSIIGYTGLVFSFRALSGEGVAGVAVGGASTNLSDPEYRIPLTAPGEVFYPIEKIHTNGPVAPEAITHLYFIFAATDGQFSFILDEIRFVPEPGSLVLLASGVALALRRRVRPGRAWPR